MPGQPTAEDTGPTDTRAALRTALDVARGHRRTGDYRVEYDRAEGAWAVVFDFDGQESIVFCHTWGNSFDRGDDQDQGKLDAEAVAASLNAVPGLLDVLAADVYAERDMLLLALERVMLGKAPTAEEREIALGPGGPLADVEYPTSAGVIAAAAPEMVRRMRAPRECR